MLRAVVRMAAEVAAQPVRWLWQEQLALGKIAVVAGAANVGKSLLVIALPRDCVLLSFAGLPGPFVRHLERQLKLVAKLFAIRQIQLVLLDKELAVHLVRGVFDQKLILVPG